MGLQENLDQKEKLVRPVSKGAMVIKALMLPTDFQVFQEKTEDVAKKGIKDRQEFVDQLATMEIAVELEELAFPVLQEEEELLDLKENAVNPSISTALKIFLRLLLVVVVAREVN